VRLGICNHPQIPNPSPGAGTFNAIIDRGQGPEVFSSTDSITWTLRGGKHPQIPNPIPSGKWIDQTEIKDHTGEPWVPVHFGAGIVIIDPAFLPHGSDE